MSARLSISEDKIASEPVVTAAASLSKASKVARTGWLRRRTAAAALGP